MLATAVLLQLPPSTPILPLPRRPAPPPRSPTSPQLQLGTDAPPPGSPSTRPSRHLYLFFFLLRGWIWPPLARSDRHRLDLAILSGRGKAKSSLRRPNLASSNYIQSCAKKKKRPNLWPQAPSYSDQPGLAAPRLDLPNGRPNKAARGCMWSAVARSSRLWPASFRQFFFFFCENNRSWSSL